MVSRPRRFPCGEARVGIVWLIKSSRWRGKKPQFLCPPTVSILTKAISVCVPMPLEDVWNLMAEIAYPLMMHETEWKKCLMPYNPWPYNPWQRRMLGKEDKATSGRKSFETQQSKTSNSEESKLYQVQALIRTITILKLKFWWHFVPHYHAAVLGTTLGTTQWNFESKQNILRFHSHSHTGPVRSLRILVSPMSSYSKVFLTTWESTRRNSSNKPIDKDKEERILVNPFVETSLNKTLAGDEIQSVWRAGWNILCDSFRLYCTQTGQKLKH